MPNEDAFWIWRPTATVAAVCDGSGPTQQCASPVLRGFARQVEEGLLHIERFPAWSAWLRDTDEAMSGRAQTTFLGVAVVNGRLLGACVGDTRAVLVNEHGCHVLSGEPCDRLGSGRAEPRAIHTPVDVRDTVLIMTDGAWAQLPPTVLHRHVMAARLQHFADLPASLMDAARRYGQPGDMTVLALRLR